MTVCNEGGQCYSVYVDSITDNDHPVCVGNPIGGRTVRLAKAISETCIGTSDVDGNGLYFRLTLSSAFGQWQLFLEILGPAGCSITATYTYAGSLPAAGFSVTFTLSAPPSYGISVPNTLVLTSTGADCADVPSEGTTTTAPGTQDCCGICEYKVVDAGGGVKAWQLISSSCAPGTCPTTTPTGSGAPMRIGSVTWIWDNGDWVEFARDCPPGANAPRPVHAGQYDGDFATTNCS